MPNRLIPVLSLSCATLFAVYVALVVATIFFAALETKLSASMRDTESRISSLETEYYDAIAKLNDTNVLSAGYHQPLSVEYVAANGKPTFTFAPSTTR
jgi:hypothetical protein